MFNKDAGHFTENRLKRSELSSEHAGIRLSGNFSGTESIVLQQSDLKVLHHQRDQKPQLEVWDYGQLKDISIKYN